MLRKIGDRLVLVGVAHVFPESMREVQDVIINEGPDIVGVELCRGRYLELTSDTPEKGISLSNLSMEAIFAKIIRSFQEKIGQQTGMLPGEEMLTAIELGQEIGAEVRLIDRDINITLQRLLDSLSFWEKCRIVLEVLLFPILSSEEIRYEDLNDEEVIEELISTLREFSEGAYRVLIEERNEFMARQIIHMLSAGNEKAVCVVGAGHISGLEDILRSQCNKEFFQLKSE